LLVISGAPLGQLLSDCFGMGAFDLFVDRKGALGKIDGFLLLTYGVEREAHISQMISFAPPVSDLS
jgi:hypothetical protein